MSNTKEQNAVQSAADFRRKYKYKRFTAGNAGKAIVLNFLYDCYQQSEGGVQEELYSDISSITQKITTYEDMNHYNAYVYFVEWLRLGFDHAVLMRNALQGAMSDYLHITKSIIAGENLRQELKTENLSEDAMLWMSANTIDSYTSQTEGGAVIQTIRDNIIMSLKYVKAFNSFIDLLAEEIRLPELSFLRVSTQGTDKDLHTLNEALSLLRVCTGEGIPSSKSLVQWTPELLQNTMERFQPIGEHLPPIPADKDHVVRERFRRDFKANNISWNALYKLYAAEYWRQMP